MKKKYGLYLNVNKIGDRTDYKVESIKFSKQSR